MPRLTLLAQQSSRRLHGATLLPYTYPWSWWSPEQIAAITVCPLEAVLEDWPIIFAALESQGIADYDTCRVVLATIAIETAHTFKPVVEAFWLDDAWRWANLRYAPYWGRGYVQLTWEDNYRFYGWRIGHPELVTFPEMALRPVIAAQLLAVFFFDHHIHVAAQQHDWRECRRLVQGADAGLTELIHVIDELGAIAQHQIAA